MKNQDSLIRDPPPKPNRETGWVLFCAEVQYNTDTIRSGARVVIERSAKPRTWVRTPSGSHISLLIFVNSSDYYACMNIDPRGGSNQRNFDQNFFKIWTSKMAYILGFIYADGSIIDARKSSRTCYTSIKINDLDLLKDIKEAVHSEHKITIRKPQKVIIRGKGYIQAQSYGLRFGSKIMFQDLIEKGVRPRKSLRIQFPQIPLKYLHDFIRGYFDGDGCASLYVPQYKERPVFSIIFTSGSKRFLQSLDSIIQTALNISCNITVYKNSGAFRLKYQGASAVKVCLFMYGDITNSIYLKRKYKKFEKYLTYI